MGTAYDFDLRRGNNVPVTWQLRTPEDEIFDASGCTVVLKITWRGGSISKTSDDDGLVLDAETGEIIWTPSLAESRLIPLGRLAKYELELRADDEQRSVVPPLGTAAAFVNGMDGLPDD